MISVSTSQKYLNLTIGETAQLQCSFSTIPDTSGLTFQWDFVERTSLHPQQLYYYQSGEDVVTKLYEGRLQVPKDPTQSRNASISITDMQVSDSGVYTCEVHNFPDVDGRSEVNIIVNVLEAPSTPFCAVHGDIEAGHLVTLTCHSERGNPPPTYSWVRPDQAKARRPAIEFQFGEYQCTVSNVVGSATCMVELSAEMEAGIIAAAVIGALLGCLLIVLIVWFIVHRVKKHRYAAVKAPVAMETQ
ncbi:hypothetical protein NHX12_010276 [Muraenolepis orangiensis]|uniref:Ig-like domain-containing protein n=1 Tax=Muraenolepis orangiensis TaxID=630683 RepID=A0A9Q0DJF2_9TELE|nr:hypothetical protein NHX12_010276 [Muraenolepis orangiensis]